MSICRSSSVTLSTDPVIAREQRSVVERKLKEVGHLQKLSDLFLELHCNINYVMQIPVTNHLILLMS